MTSQPAKRPIGSIAQWDASLPSAIVVSAVAAIAIVAIGGPSEFLYWQFDFAVANPFLVLRRLRSPRQLIAALHKETAGLFPDDPWRGHYYARDMIAPRFIKMWIQMYIRASRYRNHRKMKEYVNDALALVPLLRPRLRLIYLAALTLMRSPLLGKAMIATHHVTRRLWYWPTSGSSYLAVLESGSWC